ncbi:MAG: hypothetical protein LBS83_01595 [Holosporales bacterium]|jgi:hypothetical protein|nr:hypothetical protein [Holosporales bacterium]
MNIHFLSDLSFSKLNSYYTLIIATLKEKREEGKNKLLIDCFLPENKEIFCESEFSLEYYFNEEEKIQMFSGILCSEPIVLDNGLTRLCFQSLAEIKEYNDVLDITEYIWAETYKQTECEAPTNLNICLSAEWLQKNEGISDLGPCIAAQFSNGLINSLEKNFTVSKSIRKTGYNLLAANFESIQGPVNSSYNRLPSKPISSSKVEGAYEAQNRSVLDIHEGHWGESQIFPKPHEDSSIEATNKFAEEIELPRKANWFQCEFKIAWNYEQKRVEQIFFQLPFFGNCDEKEENIIEKFDFSLEITDIECLLGFSFQQATFFDTEIGKRAVLKALEEIRQKVVKKYKITASFDMAFEQGAKLAVGQKVKISSEKLNVCGRILKIVLVADGVYRYANVSIEITPDWLNAWEQRAFAFKILNAPKIEGFNEQLVTYNDMIDDIVVENSADVQIAKITAQEDEVNASQILAENPTKITVRLKDLTTKKVLIRKIHAFFS